MPPFLPTLRAAAVRQCATLAVAEDFSSVTKHVSVIPGPKGLPIIGSALDFLVAHRHKILEHHRTHFGPIFRETVGPMQSVNLCDPNDVQQMYDKEGVFPHRMEVPPWKLYRKVKGLPLSIVLANGREWKEARSAVNRPMLRMKSVMDHFNDIERVADRMMERLISSRQSNDCTHIHQYLFNWSLESVGTVVFERRLGCLDDVVNEDISAFIRSVRTILSPTKILFVIPQLARLLRLPSWTKHEEAWDTIYSFGRRMIEERRQEATDHNSEKVSGVLTTLLQTPPFSDKPALLDTLLTDLFLGAVDTTPNTMQFLLLLLAKHPDKQAILRGQVDDVLSADRSLSPASLQKMPYLKAVLKESLRLFPTVPVYGKVTQKDMVIRGYKIPAQTMVNVVCCAMGRDPHLFPHPDQFLPERWLQDKADIHPYASLPFGHGRRSCVGRRLAELQIHLLLCKLIQRFKIEAVDDEPIEAEVKLLMCPKVPAKVRLIDRTTL